jgi:hypothetical protein
MKGKIKAIINKNHEFICDINTIGKTGENECTELEMTLDDHLLNSWVYLDFISPDGSKYKTPRLEIVDNSSGYSLTSTSEKYDLSTLATTDYVDESIASLKAELSGGA